MPANGPKLEDVEFKAEQGEGMRSQTRILALLGLAFYLAASCYGATVSGTVKGPDGAPVEGAFVQAQNTKTRMSFFVLSDHEGHYRVEKLPAGEYRVQVKATGLRADPKSGVAVTADQSVALDFALAPGMVRWNELSIYQAKKLWPEEMQNSKYSRNVLSVTDFKRVWRP